jgi:hypothetical protein
MYSQSTSTGAIVWDQQPTIISPIKHNLTAITPPMCVDDEDGGYSVGSIWKNVTSNVRYQCIGASSGDAVWYELNWRDSDSDSENDSDDCANGSDSDVGVDDRRAEFMEIVTGAVGPLSLSSTRTINLDMPAATAMWMSDPLAIQTTPAPWATRRRPAAGVATTPAQQQHLGARLAERARADDVFDGDADKPGIECSICLDRKCNTVLTCGHANCGTCLHTIWKDKIGNQIECAVCKQSSTAIIPLFV